MVMKAVFILVLCEWIPKKEPPSLHKLEVPYDKLDVFYEFMESKDLKCSQHQYNIFDKNLLTEILLRFSQ